MQSTILSGRKVSVDWRNRFSDIFVFLWFLALTLYLTQQRDFPYIYDDEYGVLGAAAVLAGHEWTTPEGMPFYGFVLSLITFPVYWWSLDPTALYRAVLSVNAVLVALSAVLALRTVRLCLANHSEVWRIGAVMAGFSYPAVLHYSALAMGETALLFCLILVTYNFAVLVGRRHTQYRYAVFLGVGVALLPYAHSRGAVLVIALGLISLFVLKLKWFPAKAFFIAGLSAIMSVIALATIKTYLIANFYSELRSGTGSVMAFAESRLALLAPEKLVVVAQVAFGQLTYLMTSSFGLIFLGLVTITAVLWQGWSGRISRNSEWDDSIIRRMAVVAFLGLGFLSMFAVSVLQMSGAFRADHFFYGRYNEVMMPPLIIVAALLLSFMTWFSRLVWLCIGLSLAILLMMAVVQYYPERIYEQDIVWTNITSWFVHIQGPWKIQPVVILIGTLIGGAWLMIAISIARNLFLVILIAFFTVAALQNFEMQHKGADRGWAGYGELGSSFGNHMAGKLVYVVRDEKLNYLPGEALQFAFPMARVEFKSNEVDEADAILDPTHQYCNDRNTLGRVGKMSFCVINEILRRKMDSHRYPMDTTTNARELLPAVILIDENLKSSGIKTGGSITRACAWAANFFYSGWARYCLPSIDVHIARDGLTGKEQQALGIFITDNGGNWVQEWRAKLNMKALSRSEDIRVPVPVKIRSDMPTGDYWLNFALVDDQGWDWRSMEKIKLTIE